MLQIVASLTIVIDDRNKFIIQATDDKKNNLPNFLKNRQKSHQVKKAKISSTAKLNLKTQNIYIKHF